MEEKEKLELEKARLEMKMAWQKHCLEMKISQENHKVELEKKQISNNVEKSKSYWVFWFALLTFLNSGFVVFNLIVELFK